MMAHAALTNIVDTDLAVSLNDGNDDGSISEDGEDGYGGHDSYFPGQIPFDGYLALGHVET